jgi:predicted anti-sigma-YlaC factor YlaD
MQEYLDGEVSIQAQESFLEHRQSCAKCRNLWDDAQLEIQQINRLISLTKPGESLQKPFRFRYARHRKIISYLSVAAALLLIFLGIQYRSGVNARNERITRARMEAEREIYDSDPNKLWNEKETAITLIDENGNIIR